MSQAIINSIISKLKEEGLDSCNVSIDSSCDASSFRKKYNADLEKSIQVSGSLPSDQSAKLAIISKFLEEKKAELEKLDQGYKLVNKIECPIKIGDNFSTINGITDLKGNSTSLAHKQGQVLLIDFWATWCGPCQKPMQHNVDMLTKNAAKWGDKVKIAGLGMDNEKEALLKRVEERKWEKVDHYHMAGGFKHPTASSQYCVKGIPHVALIDKNGKLVFKGHPSETNLEEWMTCLVEDKEYAVRKQKKIGDNFDDISNCVDLNGNSKEIKHDGQVLMIDFWATWCGPCQKPMQHNQDMLIKNKDAWAGKVRIIGLSMDDELETVKQRVNERKWDAIEHYQLSGGFENEVASKDYKVEGIPNIIIIGKDKKLLYQGHPSQIPLEENLTKLANGEQVEFPSDEEGQVKGTDQKPKDTKSLVDLVLSVNNEDGPLKGCADAKKPWIICSISDKYLVNGTFAQDIVIIRRIIDKNDEVSQKFVSLVEAEAKKLDVKIQDR